MNSENKLIIEQLNKFGRVPQTYELLQMIEQMEQENKQLQEELKFTIGIVEHNRIISEKIKK